VTIESPDRGLAENNPTVDKFRPMQLLLDDRDILSISPPHRVFRRLRRDRRRIYRMYAAEFRRDAVAVTRQRLKLIAAASDWEDLRPALLTVANHGITWAGFQCAWLLHGLHIGDAAAIVRYLLSMGEAPRAAVRAET
jgi:hypothetical protein